MGIVERLPGAIRDLRIGWLVVGLALSTIHGLLIPLSRAFDYNTAPIDYPVVSFVVMAMTAGFIYLTLIWLIPVSKPGRGLLVFILGVGLFMRVVTLFSTPILEDDFYRYLWDGAVLSHGHDPYRYAPADVLSSASEVSESDRAELVALGLASTPVLHRVNYAHLTTIYPPVAEGLFALSAIVEPFSLTAWRLTLLAFEIGTLVLLYLLLRRLNRSPHWLAIYWWNPLVVKELVNSAHMDALLLPILLGVLLLMLLRRPVLASGCLALAAGIKLWPVLLAPIVARPLLADPKKLVGAVILFLALFCGTGYWLCLNAVGDTGLSAYARGWERNDALFLVLRWVVSRALLLFDYEWIDSGGAARALAGAAIVCLAFWLNRAVAETADQLCRRFLILIAVLFFLSPTQFPWYYTWLLPFLVVVPSSPLLLLTALLPLYYFRFHLDFRGEADRFDYGVVWLEFLPVLILLAREWWLGVRQGRPAHLEVGPA